MTGKEYPGVNVTKKKDDIYAPKTTALIQNTYIWIL